MDCIIPVFGIWMETKRTENNLDFLYWMDANYAASRQPLSRNVIKLKYQLMNKSRYIISGLRMYLRE